jgi:catalase
VPVRRVGRLVLDHNVDNFFAETEQVAFCTQNIVPGIDFTNDPLLQGRNFSYLDTQLKRLGSPNFTQLPVNAPRCPVMNFQQDGHMAVRNPTTRANYEPNSWPVEEGGPREDPAAGFTSFPAEVSGPKRRLRADSFADHYSQARQFYLSQTPNERLHIINAFVFELSKVDREDIRVRMVSGLRNVHDDLAAGVAAGLGLSELPDPAPAARPTRQDLQPSAALSIVENGPSVPMGRKIGVLVSDGVDGGQLDELRALATAQQVIVEVVAPTVSGIRTSKGGDVEVDQKIDGAPSVLYDAVVLLPGAGGAAALAELPAARDFVSDAFSHCKFIAHTTDAAEIFSALGIAEKVDEGFFALNGKGSAAEFLAACSKVRHWPREAAFAAKMPTLGADASH